MSNVYFHDRLCCAAMWASMVSTPTCDFRCWQAAWRLKGFRWFQGSQVWGMNPDRCWQKFVTKLQNELIKGMEKRVRIVIKVCRDFAWWSYLVRRLPQSWACFPYTFFKRLPPPKKNKNWFSPKRRIPPFEKRCCNSSVDFRFLLVGELGARKTCIPIPKRAPN